MNKKIVSTDENRSIKKVVLFCLVVGLLIFISLVVRFLLLLKESTFDGKGRFTMAIVQKEQPLVLLSFDPINKSISRLIVKGKGVKQPLQVLLGAPIDEVISTKSRITFTDTPSGYIVPILLHSGDIKKKITIIDLVRMLVFAKSVPAKDYMRDSLTLPANMTAIDKTSSGLFSDSQIIDEKMSIEIINGTDVPGLGKRLERIIKNIGGNVIAVSNSYGIEHSSKIQYYKKTSYTQMRLQNILDCQSAVYTKKGIADIRIIVGEDRKKTEEF